MSPRDPFGPPPSRAPAPPGDVVDVEFEDAPASPPRAHAAPPSFRCLCPPCGSPVVAGQGYCGTCAEVCLPALAAAHRRLRAGTLHVPSRAPAVPAAPSAAVGELAAVREGVKLVGDVLGLFRRPPRRGGR